MRAIEVEYEVLPHYVLEGDRSKAPETKPGREQTVGDPDGAYASAAVKVERTLAVPMINHCPLEPHGSVAEWSGDQLTSYASTQAVSTLAGAVRRAARDPGLQRAHQDRLHGRRLRLQVPGRSLGHRGGAARARSAAPGQALHRARPRAVGRRQPPLGVGDHQGGRRPRRQRGGVDLRLVGIGRAARHRHDAAALRVRAGQSPPRPHLGADQLRRLARLARAQPSAGGVPHHVGHGGPRRRAGDGPARLLPQEPADRHRQAPAGLRARARDRGRSHGLEGELEAARQPRPARCGAGSASRSTPGAAAATPRTAR